MWTRLEHRFVRTLCIAALLVAAASSWALPAAAQDSWVGQKVMPREDCQPKIGDEDVSLRLLQIPLVVQKVEGNWLWVGGAWVKSSQVVSLDAAAEYYSNLLQARPDSPEIYNLRGLVWVETGEPDRAIEDFNASIRLNPDDPAPVYNNRGMAWFHKQAYDRAIEDFTESARINPNYAQAYANRAWTWQTKQEYGRAIDDYTRTLLIDPTYTKVYYNRGFCRLSEGDHELAIEDFNAEIERDPQAVEAYNDRGNAWFNLKKYDKAIADHTEAIRINPDYSYAYFNRGWTYDALDDYEKALRDYAKAAELQPENASLWNTYAWTLATCPDPRQRKGVDAVAAATRASELTNWNDPVVLDTLAAAWAEAGDFDKAIDYQAKALELAPEEQQEEIESRLVLYRAGKPYHQLQDQAIAGTTHSSNNSTPAPAGDGSTNEPTQSGIHIDEGELTIQGTRLTLPCSTADLLAALGAPDRRLLSVLHGGGPGGLTDDADKANQLVWDDMGLLADRSPKDVSSSDGNSLAWVDPVRTLTIALSDRPNKLSHEPHNTYSDTLVIDGVPITAQTTLEEINENRKEHPFAPDSLGWYVGTSGGIQITFVPAKAEAKAAGANLVKIFLKRAKGAAAARPMRRPTADRPPNSAPTPGPEDDSLAVDEILIPAGEFVMGNPNDEEYKEHEVPPHRVRISKPFYLGRYEVTQGQYRAVVGDNPSEFSPTGEKSEAVADLETDNLPVENVSWYDAVIFCNKLSEQHGLSPYYVLENKRVEESTFLGEVKRYTRYDVTIAGGHGYRLPSEAEWEYACRAGTTTPYSFGSAANGREANVSGKYPHGTDEQGPDRQHPLSVGSFAPNEFGLYDMHGNVWELCNDVKDWTAYASRRGLTVDPMVVPEVIVGGPNTSHVKRGGSWQNGAIAATSHYRMSTTASFRSGDVGFRVARTAE